MPAFFNKYIFDYTTIFSIMSGEVNRRMKTVEFQVVLKDYKNYLAYELGLASNTLDAYLHDAQSFFTSQSDILNCTTIHVVQYMTELRTEQYAIETILRRLSGISAFYDFLIKERKVEVNPVNAISKPQKWDKLPVFLEFSEVEALIAAPDLSTAHGFRNKVMLEMLYSTGIRVSELVGILIKDMDMKRGIVKVIGKGSKQRIVPLYDDLIQHIAEYLQIRHEHFVKERENGVLFLNRRGGQLSRAFCWSMVKACCKKAGITKNVSPHTIRHSFATHLLTGGADLRTIQMFLGHSSISTTEIYTHVTDDGVRDVLSHIHPRFKK